MTLIVHVTEPTLFVAAFNDEDPGSSAVAQRCITPFFSLTLPPKLTFLSSPVFGLPPDIISATLGDIGVIQVAELESKVLFYLIRPFSILIGYFRYQTTSHKERMIACSDAVSKESNNRRRNASLVYPTTPFHPVSAVPLLPQLLPHHPRRQTRPRRSRTPSGAGAATT
jgi:hypothetical protein